MPFGQLNLSKKRLYVNKIIATDFENYHHLGNNSNFQNFNEEYRWNKTSKYELNNSQFNFKIYINQYPLCH